MSSLRSVLPSFYQEKEEERFLSEIKENSRTKTFVFLKSPPLISKLTEK